MMFLRDWTAAGGSAFLLLQVGRVGNPLILMNAALAGRFFHETLTVRGLLAEATIIGTYRELLLCLTRT
jgi:hypothetical protein